MSRVKRGMMVKARHKKVIKMAKGYKYGRSKLFTLAKQAVMKAGTNAYRDRRLKKRDFRTLWNSRISAAVKPHGLNYSRFINKLFTKEIILNRKMISEIAIHYPEAFEGIVKSVK